MRINWTWLLALAFVALQCQKDNSQVLLTTNDINKITTRFGTEMPTRYLAALIHLSEEEEYLIDAVMDIGTQLQTCQYKLACLSTSLNNDANRDFRSSLRTIELPEVSVQPDQVNWTSTYDRSTHQFRIEHKTWHYTLDFDMDNEIDDQRSIGIIPEVNGLSYKVPDVLGLTNNIYEPSASKGRVEKINIYTQGEQVRFEFIIGPYPGLNNRWRKQDQITTSVEFYIDVNQHLGLECTGMYKVMFNKEGTQVEITSDASEVLFYEVHSGDDFIDYLDGVKEIAIQDQTLGYFELSTAVDQLQISTQQDRNYLEFDFGPAYQSSHQLVHSFFTIMEEVSDR